MQSSFLKVRKYYPIANGALGNNRQAKQYRKIQFLQTRPYYQSQVDQRQKACSTLSVAQVQTSSLFQQQDVIATIIAGLGAFVWVKLFDVLVERQIIGQKLSRKLVHTTTGPLFVLTWPLYSESVAAPFIASIIPGINLVRLLAAGSGAADDQGLVKSLTRTGARQELLRGPLCYVIVLLIATTVFWRGSAIGIASVAMMCGGDGLADIIGRRFGQAKLWYNTNKSWAGSVAMLLGGWGMAMGLVALLHLFGVMHVLPAALTWPLFYAALAATLVESLPINQIIDDNLSVPLIAAMVTCRVLV